MHITVSGNRYVSAYDGDTRNDYVSEIQLNVFTRYKRKLKSKFDVTSVLNRCHTTQEIFEFCDKNDADAYFIRVPWSLNVRELHKRLENLKSKRPYSKIVLIDPFDQTSSKFFGCLDLLDVMLKYQCLKDRTQYLLPADGGHTYSDYYSKKFGCNNVDGSIQYNLCKKNIHKIKSGWSLAEHLYNKKYLYKNQLLNRLPFKKKKDIDIFCRLRISKDQIGSYYEKNRSLAVDNLAPLKEKYNLASNLEIIGNPNTETISRKQYLSEIKRSKISLCSFGWGEQTYREFEAISNHSLIIKPDMSHLEVFPSIYRPNETYVPVKWDYSDLEEKCKFYLANEDKRNKIINNARLYYFDYFRNNCFLDKFEEVFKLINQNH